MVLHRNIHLDAVFWIQVSTRWRMWKHMVRNSSLQQTRATSTTSL